MTRRARLFSVVVALLMGLSLAPTGDARADSAKPAAAKKAKTPKKTAKKKEASRSIGAPNDGKLTGAKKLKRTDDVLIKKGASTWALPELNELVLRATHTVRKKHGGRAALIGDMSAKAGGPLVGHNSHQTGRDVDIGFYVLSSKGKPFRSTRFLPFSGDGKGKDVSWARFDDVRNWALVKALSTDKKVAVRHIFVTLDLKARLIAYARKQKEPEDLILRASSVMLSPKDADVHDDHFHVRISCPESMRDVCIEDSRLRPAPAKADVDGHAPAAAAAEPSEDAKAPTDAAPAAKPEPKAEPEAPAPAKED